jgi:hypothetical protein
MTSYLMIAALVGLATSPASVSQGQSNNLAVEAPAKPVVSKAAEEVKYCRRIVPTGSIMAKRLCFTKADWQEFDARTAEGAESFLARRTAGNPADKN